MKKILFFLFVSFMIINSLKAQDPYGCVVYYNGATTLFTDYVTTDNTGSRHYKNSPSKNYYIRYGSLDPHCGILVDYVTPPPYGGGCTVNGVNTGGMAHRISVNTCPLDDYLPFLLFASGVFGFFILRRRAMFV